ncbi:MAG TPA: hypothetical protein PLW93_05850 [Candidatus Absconditabacterales bacterium]|nr:hypothetical protein [Candidatus Absconditabacterales bacterium]
MVKKVDRRKEYIKSIGYAKSSFLKEYYYEWGYEQRDPVMCENILLLYDWVEVDGKDVILASVNRNHKKATIAILK